MSTPQTGPPPDAPMSSQEMYIQERLVQQDKLRQEHRKEEALIRQEKLNLIQQEELLIRKQEEMLKQIEAEREKLRNQEDAIRSQQQERLQNVRQEKLLLERQEEMLYMRKEQLMQERLRQDKLRDEQRNLKEQEEAIKKRQEQISKELMGGASVLLEPHSTQEEFGLLLTSTKNKDIQGKLEGESVNDGAGATGQLQVTFNSVNDYCEPPPQNDDDMEDGNWSCSGSDDDTLDEECEECYECKVEVKQNQTSVPTSVRTIETKIDNPPWAPVTPYLTYSEKQNVQEEVSAIFSQTRTSQGFTKPGITTSPESVRTSTNLITTPEGSLSYISQRSSQTDPQSQSSSRTSSPPPPIPPLPDDKALEAQGGLKPVAPKRTDSYETTSSYLKQMKFIPVNQNCLFQALISLMCLRRKGFQFRQG